MYRSNVCDSEDARADQPLGILVPMKPHQLTAIHKMKTMETTNTLWYGDEGMTVSSATLGILADKAGYGKTLTMLGLICSNDDFCRPNDRHMISKTMWCGQSFSIRYDQFPEPPVESYITSTLIVVPHGPVFSQWQRAIQSQTVLNMCPISSSPELAMVPRDLEEARRYLSTFDIVLVSGTYYPRFREKHDVTPGLQFWNRSVIDEPHSISMGGRRMRDITTKFAWFITATPENLKWPVSTGYVRQSWPNHLAEAIKYLTVKNTDDYVSQSFSLPGRLVKRYLCKDRYNLFAINGFASAAVMDMLNADDIDAAMHVLRGNVGDDIMTLIADDLKIDIANKTIEIEGIGRQTLPEREKRLRLERAAGELRSLKDRYENIQERMNGLDEKDCAICYEIYKDPVSLPCTHVFCGNCIMRWVKEKTGRYHSAVPCPICNVQIGMSKIVRLTGEVSEPMPEPSLTKEQVVLRLLTDYPDGKFILFSNHDGSFRRLQESLHRANIDSKQLKGQASIQTRVLDEFRTGQVKVIMLNSRYCGSGIDIHEATDVILYQAFDQGTTQQVCARADRVGRTAQLRVHHLYHFNELKDVKAADCVVTM